MKQEKEKWIEGVLGSSKEIKRAEASPFLFTRIKEKINGLMQWKDTQPCETTVCPVFCVINPDSKDL